MNSNSSRRLLAVLGLALAQATVALATTPAMARQPDYYTTTADHVALSGYDTVAYFTVGKPTKGDPAIKSSYNGATWYFSSQDNRKAFDANPEKFVPQFGGYCAYAVSQGHTASADPNAWKIVDGKLYVNYSPEVGRIWQKDIPGYISKAKANWPKVLDE